VELSMIDDLPPEAAIELILAGPDPLTPELVRAALDLVGSGALGSNTRAVALILAQRIPLPLTAEVSERQEHHVYGPGRGTISAVLLARDGFAVMEQVLQARLAIAAAFEPVAGSGPDVGAGRTTPGSAPEAPGKMKP
jgi:hypothetical protein